MVCTANCRRIHRSMVRGARNAPCMDKPGKRAPTVEICQSDEPYRPLAMRQHSLGPYPFDPNLVGQGVPLDDRVTFRRTSSLPRGNTTAAGSGGGPPADRRQPVAPLRRLRRIPCAGREYAAGRLRTVDAAGVGLRLPGSAGGCASDSGAAGSARLVSASAPRSPRLSMIPARAAISLRTVRCISSRIWPTSSAPKTWQDMLPK